MNDPLKVIQFPGEPDDLAEMRLRYELRLLRDWATRTEHMNFMVDIIIHTSPEIAGNILRQTSLLEGAKRHLGKRLLNIEAYFIEKQWRLPEWQRPPWLMEIGSSL